MGDRRVELKYVFDRLGEAHLAQAYRMLVPERRWLTGGGIGDGDGSDLRTGLLGPTEGLADDRQPDRGVAGARRRHGPGDSTGLGVRG